MQALIGANKQDYDNKMTKYDSILVNINTLIKQMLVQSQNSSPDMVESPKSQASDTFYLVPDPLMTFAPSEQYWYLIKW